MLPHINFILPVSLLSPLFSFLETVSEPGALPKLIQDFGSGRRCFAHCAFMQVPFRSSIGAGRSSRRSRRTGPVEVGAGASESSKSTRDSKRCLFLRVFEAAAQLHSSAALPLRDG